MRGWLVDLDVTVVADVERCLGRRVFLCRSFRFFGCLLPGEAVTGGAIDINTVEGLNIYF